MDEPPFISRNAEKVVEPSNSRPINELTNSMKIRVDQVEMEDV
jgi:hypothetical protein